MRICMLAIIFLLSLVLPLISAQLCVTDQTPNTTTYHQATPAELARMGFTDAIHSESWISREITEFAVRVTSSRGLVRREFGYPIRILYCDAVFVARFGDTDRNLRHLNNGWSPIIDLKGRGPAWLGPLIPLGVRWPNYLAAVASLFVLGVIVLKLGDACIAILRRRRGLCPTCAYPLAPGICPECGTRASVAQ